MNSFDWFSKWNVYSPNSIAVKEYESNKSYSYSQLNKYANILANYFYYNLNLRLGNRVSILAENCIEYAVLFGIAQKIGIVLVPLNYRLSSNELDYVISNCESSLIIVEDKYFDKVKDLESYKSITNKLNLVELKKMVEDAENNPSIKDFQPTQISEDDTIFILYTSGTTAFPKGAIYTHKMLFWNSINTELRLNITSNDKSINCAPPFHTGSWNVLLTPFFHHGACTIFMKNFEADIVLNILESEKITLWWAVPTMLKMMSQSNYFYNCKFKSLRYFVVGGEALPLDIIKIWHDKGVLIRQGYGLTEVGPNVTSLSHEDAIRKLGSIGTPNFYIQTKIVDENSNEILDSGTGELLLKGPNVTPGYWKNEKATSDTIKNGWFATGDVVMRDEEGFLYVVDRIKNMYISGGENVYPAEVEHLLRKHEGIKDVAIVGTLDEKWGEVGKAFIVLRKGIHLSVQDIIDYCMGKLAKYKIPKHIKFLDQLPTNDAGKIDRKKLKTLL